MIDKVIIMTPIAGLPIYPAAQANQRHHHSREWGHGGRLPRLLRKSQESIRGGESTLQCLRVQSSNCAGG